jgi:uncharacterized protein involved in response to NO
MNLWDTPAGFDEPLAALSACHRRIEKQMATRVTYGHSGRTVVADGVTWALFLIFQSVAVSRVAAEVFPAHYAGFIVFASSVWALCFGLWGWRNASIYLSPRIAGMAG